MRTLPALSAPLFLLASFSCTQLEVGHDEDRMSEDGSMAVPLAPLILTLDGITMIEDEAHAPGVIRVLGGAAGCGDGTWLMIEGEDAKFGAELWFTGPLDAGATSWVPLPSEGWDWVGGALAWSEVEREYFAVSGTATISAWTEDHVTLRVAGEQLARMELGGDLEPIEGGPWTVEVNHEDVHHHVPPLAPSEPWHCANEQTMQRPAGSDWCERPSWRETLPCSCFIGASGEIEPQIVDTQNPDCQPRWQEDGEE